MRVVKENVARKRLEAHNLATIPKLVPQTVFRLSARGYEIFVK